MGHLHLDHAGGLEHFQNTRVPIYVHEDELKHACWAAATNLDAGLYLFVAQMTLSNLGRIRGADFNAAATTSGWIIR